MGFKLFSNRYVRAVLPFLVVFYSLLALSGYASDSAIGNDITNPPVITLNGDNPLTIVLGGTYIEPNAIASDPEDAGSLTNAIVISGVDAIDTSTVNTYLVQYGVTDSDGNYTEVTRTVNIVDTTPPILNLNGNSITYVEVGTTYNELGATATDNYDDNNIVTNGITLDGVVNTALIG